MAHNRKIGEPHSRSLELGRLARRQVRALRWLTIGATGAAMLLGMPVSAAGQVMPTLEVEVLRSRSKGMVKLVRPVNGNTVSIQSHARRSDARAAALHRYGHLFGVEDAGQELFLTRVNESAHGRSHASYIQYHRGVRVFSAVLKVHQNRDGEVSFINGDFHRIPSTLNTKPALGAPAAIELAVAEIAVGAPVVDLTELVIVDPAWYGDPPKGERLAYYLVLTDISVPLREALFVDAHSGEILDRWSLIEVLPDQ